MIDAEKAFSNAMNNNKIFQEEMKEIEKLITNTSLKGQFVCVYDLKDYQSMSGIIIWLKNLGFRSEEVYGHSKITIRW